MRNRVPLWREFFSQKEIRQAVRIVVNQYPMETEFESPLISDLIAERHYFCSINGLRPTKFKRVQNNNEQLHGFFDGNHWHPISWFKAAGNPPSQRAHINQALRERIKPLKITYFQSHRICEYCNKASPREIHHETPEWKEIMNLVFAAVTTEDVKQVMDSWDWFKADAFVVPDDSKIAEVFDRIHETAVLKALCKNCHDSTK